MKKFFSPKIEKKDSEVDHKVVPESVKYANSSKGVPAAMQQAMGLMVEEINNHQLDNESIQTKLHVIDSLTLHANHLDQQTNDREMAKLAPQDKQQKVLAWLEAAYTMANQILPVGSLVAAKSEPDFSQYAPEMLSTISMLLHYLGKARRYAGIDPQERLPLLKAALSMSQLLSGA